MRIFGIIGYPLSHSFSKRYFTEKFGKEKIEDARYEVFPLESLNDFESFLDKNPGICGLNVTIPHKIGIIQHTDWQGSTAKEIGAVNCLRISNESPVSAALTGEVGFEGHNYRVEGFNTDAYGFEASLKPLLTADHDKALILGDGGAAQSIKYVLANLGIPYIIVTRKKEPGRVLYTELTKEHLDTHKLIINTTPLGTSPNMDACPPIPYEFIGEGHLLYDLVYNPEITLFMKNGAEHGAVVKNGYEMLVLQAERSWEIWNSNGLND